MKDKHTPWKIFKSHDLGIIEIQSHEDDIPPIVSWLGFDDSDRSRNEHLAHAHLIIAAVNAHAGLVAAIEAAAAELENYLGVWTPITAHTLRYGCNYQRPH